MDAQHVIEGAIRIIGCAGLYVVTLGRYRGPKKDALLLEGGVGLAVVVAASYSALYLD
jgi:hypothetical protein